MSKFIELLGKTREVAPEPLGFGTTRAPARNPSVILIGQASAADIEKDPGLSKTDADAILLTMSSSNEKTTNNISKILKGQVWGVRVGSISEEQSMYLKEKGCDFVVFDPDNTAAGVLNDEDLGKVIVLSPDLEEEEGHAINGLPVDSALYSPLESIQPLTVQKLIEIEMARAMTGLMFIMSAPGDLVKADIQALRNGGVAGLVIPLDKSNDISKTKELINELPRRPEQNKRNLAAQAPAAGFAAFSSQNEPDEEEEEDF